MTDTEIVSSLNQMTLTIMVDGEKRRGLPEPGSWMNASSRMKLVTFAGPACPQPDIEIDFSF